MLLDIDKLINLVRTENQKPKYEDDKDAHIWAINMWSAAFPVSKQMKKLTNIVLPIFALFVPAYFISVLIVMFMYPNSKELIHCVSLSGEVLLVLILGMLLVYFYIAFCIDAIPIRHRLFFKSNNNIELSVKRYIKRQKVPNSIKFSKDPLPMWFFVYKNKPYMLDWFNSIFMFVTLCITFYFVIDYHKWIPFGLALEYFFIIGSAYLYAELIITTWLQNIDWTYRDRTLLLLWASKQLRLIQK